VGAQATFTGHFQPNALISFSENNTIIGTAVTDTTGLFSKNVTAITPGIHSIVISASDTNGNSTPGLLFEFLIQPNQSIDFSDILIPPTIKIQKTEYSQAEEISAQGFAKPNSIIELDLQGITSQLFVLNTNAQGFYKYIISPNTLSLGDFILKARVESNFATYSEYSSSVNFKVVKATSTQTNPNLPQKPIVNEVDNCLARFPYPRLCIFDTDGSGSYDVFDELTSIVLGFIDNYKKNISNAFDINEDNVVGPTDLSIMLYYVKSLPYDVMGVSNNTSLTKISRIAPTTKIPIEGMISSIPSIVTVQLIIGCIALIVFIPLFILKKRKTAENEYS